MTTVLRIYAENDEALQGEARQAFEDAGIEIQPRAQRTRGATDIIIALSSAGAFTTLYQTIAKLLEKIKNRELTIERTGLKISIKGQSFPEERELLEKVAPELIGQRDS